MQVFNILGKIPSGSESRVKFEQSVDELKTISAIEKEDFELAAEGSIEDEDVEYAVFKLRLSH